MRIPFTNLQITRAIQAVREEDIGYRTVGATQKDLLFTDYQQLHEEAYEAYNGNPIAYRVIELITAYLWGTGPKITSPDPAVLKVIEAYWRKNDMQRRGQQIARELHLYGEQFIIHRGRGLIGQLDPATIDEVKCDINEAGKTTAFHQSAISELSTEGRWYNVPQDGIHFAINRVSNATRGRSTLWVILPWLRRYREWLSDRVRLNRGRASWLWTVAVKNFTPDKRKAKQALYSEPPEPGSVLFHAEDEAWEAKGLNLEAGDARYDGAALKVMIAAGAGIPIHWLSEVISGTRAVAAEMGGPSIRTFEMLQQDIRRVVEDLLRAEIRRVRLPADSQFSVAFADLTPTDNLQLAAAVAKLTPALVIAKAQGWLDDAAATQWLYQFAAKPATLEASEQQESTQGETE